MTIMRRFAAWLAKKRIIRITTIPINILLLLAAASIGFVIGFMAVSVGIKSDKVIWALWSIAPIIYIFHWWKNRIPRFDRLEIKNGEPQRFQVVRGGPKWLREPFKIVFDFEKSRLTCNDVQVEMKKDLRIEFNRIYENRWISNYTPTVSTGTAFVNGQAVTVQTTHHAYSKPSLTPVFTGRYLMKLSGGLYGTHIFAIEVGKQSKFVLDLELDEVRARIEKME